MKKLLLIVLAIVTVLTVFGEPEWLIENVQGGKRGGILYLSATSGPKTYNPFWSQERTSSDIIDYFTDTLLHLNYTGMADRPGLASKFWNEETKEGVIYYFTLRKGLQWSDGKPLTIDDVIFSFEMAFDSKMSANGNGSFLDANNELPKMEKVGTDTVKFTYKTKYRTGFLQLGGQYIIPKHIFSPAAGDPEKFAQIWTIEQTSKLVGVGPFLVKEYKDGVRIVLERNPNYYVKSKDGVQLPYLDQIVYIIVPDTNTQRLKFEAGDFEVYGVPAESFPAIKALSKEKGWTTIVGSPNPGPSFVAFNFNAPDVKKRAWFRNVNFRKAVSYSINRKALIDNNFNGYGEETFGPEVSSSPYYNTEVDKMGYKYSLTTAKKLLEQGGFVYKGKDLYDKEGNRVEFDLSTNVSTAFWVDVGNILAESLSKLGIKVNFRPIDFNTLVTHITSDGKWDCVVLRVSGDGADPASGWNTWQLDGGLHFWNASPDVFDFVDKADYVVPESEKRLDEIFRLQAVTIDQNELDKLFKEYQKIVAENQILIHTVAQNYLVAFKSTVHIFNPKPAPLAKGVLWAPWAIWKD